MRLLQVTDNGGGGAEAGRRLRGDQRHSGSEHGILCLELLEE